MSLAIIIALLIVGVILIIVCVAAAIMCLQDIQLKRFLSSTMSESQKIFFHGFSLTHYIVSDAFIRLESWLGSGLCYELSILAMILMKNNKTARLCRGDYVDKAGRLKTRHSWVEAKVPLNGWIVIDLACLSPIFCKRDQYYKYFDENGRLGCKWLCTYDEFWKTPFAKVIAEAVKKPETSNILSELAAFGSPECDYGFRGELIENSEPIPSGKKMPTHYRYGSKKPVSTEIIRDFVKNPRRKDPKTKSIRLAKAGR